MKSVLIDLEKIRYPLNGIGQYNLRFGNCLAQHPEYWQNSINPHLLVPKKKVGCFGDQLKYYPDSKPLRVAPFLQKSFDLWHASYQSPRHMPFSKKTKFIYSIMDLNFIHEVSDQNQVKEELARIQKSVDRSCYITVISNYVKNDIQENLKTGDRPIKVVYLSHSLDRDGTPEKSNLVPESSPFIFSIGVVDPKKNFHVVLPIIEKSPDLNFVIAGPNQTDYAQQIIDQAKKLGVSDRIHLAGPITDNEKLWYYQNCQAFVFPSLYEGFGIPPIEAMSIGKPVFISDRCSLPEVTGGLAYTWNSFDPDHVIEVFEQGMQDYANNSQKKQQLIDFSNRYSWEQTTRDYLSVYDEVLNESPH